MSDSLTIHEASQLNVAESGAMSEDMPFMAETLIKRIKRDPRINMQKQWKVCCIKLKIIHRILENFINDEQFGLYL